MVSEDDFVSGYGKNSWVFSQELHKCRSLFSGIESDYMVYAYQCKCTHKQTFICTKPLKYYICEECGSSSFLDESIIANRHNDLLVNIDFPPVVKKHDNFYSVSLFFNKPLHLDLVSNKLDFKLQKVYEFQLSFNAKEKILKTYTPTESTRRLAYRVLIDFIAEDLLTQIKDFNILEFHSKTPHIKEKIVLFFLSYSQLTEAQYYFWNYFDSLLYNKLNKQTQINNSLMLLLDKHQSKSLKKVIYQRYQYEMQTEQFNPVIPYVICRIFKDSNRVRTLLEDKDLTISSVSGEYFSEYASNLFAIFRFLKLHYSEHQLMLIVQDIKYHREIFEDILSMFQRSAHAIRKHFHKTNANINALHNEFIRSNHIEEFSQNYRLFKYSTALKNSCVTSKGITFKLPKDTLELNRWSRILHNCMFSYIEDIYENHSTIFGAFINDKLTYAIEISNNKIIQMKGKYNNSIPYEDRGLINEWYQKREELLKMHKEKHSEVFV